MSTAVLDHAEKHWESECDHKWIAKEGEELVKWKTAVQSNISLVKWFCGLIFGGQVLTVALLIYYK